MLTVNTLTFNNASNVEVNQGQLNSSMNWLKIDDKGEGQTLIQGKIKGHDYATVKFNDEVVNGGEVVAQKVLNDSGTEVAEASFKIGLVKNSSEIGLNKELKSLKLVDADGDGLLIKPSADAEKDSDFTLSTQLTGNGNVTFDAGGKKVIVQSSIAKPNNYSGKTFVKNGTVETNGNDAFGSTSELNLKSTGKVALGNQLYVGGLVSEKDSVVYLNGHDLTIGYASDSKVDGTLSGAGNIKLYNSFITLSNANTDLSANVKMEGSTIVLNDLDGLGTGVVNAETQSSLTLAADGVFDNKLKGKIDLRVGDGTASTPVPIDVRLTGDNTKLNGKVLMNAGSTLRVTSIEQNLGSSAIETTGGKLYVDEASEEIANIITGSGELHLAAKGMESSFKNGGVDNFDGKVYAESVKLKASGTEKQFAQADVTFGNGAQYKADKSVLMGALHAEKGSTLDFTGKVNKLLVTNDLTVGAGANVSADVPGALKENILDQIEGESVVLAIANSVTVDKDAKLNGKAIEQETKAMVGGDAALATYSTKLSDADNMLSVESKLTALDLKAGKTLDINAKTVAYNILSASVTGSGNLNFVAGDVVFSSEDNSYTGTTTLTDGTLKLTGKNALGNTEALHVKAGETTVAAAQDNVGSLKIDQGAKVALNDVLILNNGDSYVEGAGALGGNGKLLVKGGELAVRDSNADFEGTTTLTKKAAVTMNLADSLGGDKATINLADGTLNLAASADAALAAKLEGKGTLEVDLNDTNNALELSNTGNNFTGLLKLKNAGMKLAGNNADTLKSAALETGSGAKVDVAVGEQTVREAILNGGELAFEKLTVGGDATNTSILAADKVTLKAENVTKVSVGTVEAIKGALQGNVLDADNEGEKDTLIKSADSPEDVDNLKLKNKLAEVTQELAGAEATWAFEDKLVRTDDGLGLNRKLKTLNLTSDFKIDSTTAKDTVLSAQLTGTGNVAFEGNKSVTIANGANNYTGNTTIENTVVAGVDNALGATSALDIKKGGQFDLNGKTQTVKNLTTKSGEALRGGGSLTLQKTSTIAGDNSNFTAVVNLAASSDTTLDNAEGLGSGTVNFEADSAKLTLNGVNGVYGNQLKGNGNLHLAGSDVTLANSNQGFGGDISFANDGRLSVTTPTMNQIGNAKVNTKDGTLAIKSEGNLNFENVVTGNGVLDINTQGNNVNLTKADKFNGTLKLTETSIDGEKNADVLDEAKVELFDKSTLTVKTDGQKVDSLKVDGTSKLQFTDAFALGAEYKGKLDAKNGIELADGATVSVDRTSVESAKNSAANDDRNLLDQDVAGNAVTLATGKTSVGKVTLVDRDEKEITSAVTTAVTSDGVEVADATYDFSVNGDDKGLHIGYQLEKVDVRDGKMLVLDTKGANDHTFSAELVGKGGLAVRGDTVTLSHIGNTYEGETMVEEGNLVASAENALGNTRKVTVKNDKTLTIQANQDHVGSLEAVDGTVALENNAALTLNNGKSTIAAAAELKGDAGTTLVVIGGELDVKGANARFLGNATLENNALVTLNDVAGLGNDADATIAINGSKLAFNLKTEAELKSKIEGNGTISADLGDQSHALSFANDGNAFTGKLELNKGALALAGNKSLNTKTLEKATLETGAGAYVTVSNGENKLGNLTLAGGKIGFGVIALNGADSAGFVELGKKGELNILKDTTVDLSLAKAATISKEGSELLSMDDGAYVPLVKNASDTINGVDKLKFKGKLDQESELTQDGKLVADATWALDGKDTFKLENEGHDLVVNYKLQELKLLETTVNKGLVVTNKTAADQTLSAKLTGAGNIRFNGDATFGGGTITVNNVNNDYTGITYIERGEVIAGADNALGQTKELNISSGASFNLDSRSQTVGDLITASGNALKSTGGSLTLKGSNSHVKGANAGLNARIALADNSKTTLDNVLGLGSGAIAIGSGDDVLTLSNASGKFANALTGNGGLTLANGSDVELTGANAAYEGKVTANAGTTLTVNGPVADHLGKGQLHVDGSANLTQSGDWKLNNKLTGNGKVTVSADKAGGDGTFALGTGADRDFNGNLVLTEANMTLSDVASSEGRINAEALDKATLTASTNGVVNVEKGNAQTGNLTMNGGTLVFAGSATPGVHQSETAPVNPSKAEAHLTVKKMDLTDGTVKVDLSANVNPDFSEVNDSLTMQDVLDWDQGDVTTTLVTANAVTGSVGSLKLVDQHGNTVVSSKTLKIQDEGGNVVADGEYGLGLAVKNQKLGLAYQLNTVRVHDGKILTLKGTAPASASDDNNTLSAVLTGQGGLKVSEGAITLANNQNGYTGMTEVLNGATLNAGSDNAFGPTSGLVNNGTVNSNGFKQTIYGSVDNVGTLNIAGGSWTVNKDLNQTGTLAVTAGANLSVKGNAVMASTSTVNGSVLTVAETATVTGTTQLENATVNFGNGGSAAEGKLVGTTGNKLNFNGGEFRMLGANAGLTAASAVASGAVLTLEKSADAVGKNGTVYVAGQLNLKGANGDFSNALSGSGKVDFVGTNAAFTADNSAFKGTITLDDASNLKVTTVNQLGDAAATIAGSGLVTMTSDAALNVNQNFTGSVNIDKLGAGDLVMADQSLGSKGLIRMKGGTLRFGTPAAGAAAAGSVELEAGTAMSAFGTVAGDLTINDGASAFVSGDAAAKASVTAPMLLKVGSRTVNKGTLQIGHIDGPDANTIGSRFETNGYESANGTIVVNALLNGDDDSKLDTFKTNGAASGTGKLTVNTVDAAGLGITRNVNGVTVAEFGEGTVDLSLTDEIKVNGLYYRLMKTDDGSRYYLSNQIQSAGTEAMSTSMLMQPEAGARAALAYAADQAFNISLHDHVGETLYIDQLTGEERLTSVWMAQTGDWTRWRDGTGQLYNKGQTLTTHIGGDLITWGPADKYRLSFGLLGGYSYADFDSTSDLTGWNAKGTFNGYSVGAYLAWQNVAEDGPFGSVQLRWNSFRNSVQGDGYEKEKYTSDGISAALEAGWNQQLLHMKLENGTSALWRVQPHVGVYWSNISADEQTDANGQRFETDGDNNVTLRLGGRTSITFAETQVPGVVDPGLTFYVEGNWIRNTGNYTTTVFNQNGESTADLTADNLGEVRFGVEGHVNRNIQLWGDVHHRVGDQSYRSTGVMLGGKYVW